MGDVQKALREIQEQIGGNWKFVRGENLEDALKEMGLNIVFRKLAAHAKPTMEVKVEDNKVVIIPRTAFYSQTMVLPLNEPYEQEFEGIKMNCMTTWTDNTLITEAIPVEPGKHKAQKFHRERVNNELVQTMWIGDVKCTRVFKPASA